MTASKRDLGEPYRRSLEIDLDRRSNCLIVAVIYQDCDQPFADTAIINMAPGAGRIPGYYDPHEYYDFPLPHKTLIDVEQSFHKNIDMVKLDCGPFTLTVLECLSELIEQYDPLLFVCHDSRTPQTDLNRFFANRYASRKTEIDLPSQGGEYFTYCSLDRLDSK